MSAQLHNQPIASPPAKAGAVGQSREYLTFALDNETFAIEVGRVREVLDLPEATIVPNAPDFAPAIINVRGNVVPLVDLRRRFGMGSGAIGDQTRVVVAEVSIGGEPVLVGITADAVYEVIDAAHAEIDAVPKLGTRWRSDFLRGVVKRDQGFVIILDIERILAHENLALRPAKLES
jgi:purine-binding chemotaxis protein CheW